MKAAKTLAGFGLLPLAGLFASLVVLPAISARFGSEGWAAIAIGLSTGSAAAVVVDLSWGLTGPPKVARASRSSSGAIYVLALVTKLYALMPVSLAIPIVTFFLAPSHRVEAALMSLAIATSGLSPAWYFVGRGKPSYIWLSDVGPRMIMSLLAALLIWLGAPLAVYPTALLVASSAAPLVGLRLSGSNISTWRRYRRSRILVVIRLQAVSLRGRIISSLYMTLPVTIVAMLAPEVTAAFAAIDRLQRMALQFMNSLPQSMQGWVGEPPTRERRLERVRIALLVNVSAGIVAGVAFALLSPWAAQVLFAGEVRLDPISTALAGGIIFVTCVSRVVGGMDLVIRGLYGDLSTSALVGAVIGVILLLLLSHSNGVNGAMLALLAAEIGVLLYQILSVLKDRTRDIR